MRRYPLLFLATVAFCPGADDPRGVASAVLAAWTAHDARALTALAHPEFLLHGRAAPGLHRYLAAHTPPRTDLAALATRRASAASTPAPIALNFGPATSDAEVVNLLMNALEELEPQNPTVFRQDVWRETIAVGELAIVTFESNWRKLNDPTTAGSSSRQVFLRRSGDDWRFLWSSITTPLFESTWNPGDQLGLVVLKTEARTTISISNVQWESGRGATKLKLPPGDYEVVGRRPGYRDVKWMLRVPTDLEPIELTVICTIPLK